MSEENVILQSRIRLSRNFADLFFPCKNGQHAGQCIERVRHALGEEEYTFYSLYETSPDDRDLLLEENLITKNLLKNTESGAVFVRKKPSVCVMVNEDDHVRVQAIHTGLNLAEALSEAFEVEKRISAENPFSFDERLGYLTSCPTSTGTGLRASLLLHLPAVVRQKKIGELIQNVAQLGMTLRGVLGEGNEALGDVFLLSNHATLGRSESEITDSITAVGKQIAQIETDCRSSLLMDETQQVLDVIGRAKGILQNSHLMDFQEFCSLWSALRLGTSYNLTEFSQDECNAMLVQGQNAHVLAKKQSDETLLQARSRIIRETMNVKSGL